MAARVIADRYLLSDRLGVGAFAEVWAARDKTSSREVAIKLLRAPALSRPDLRMRFEREAELARRIESDHVCRVLDAGRLSSGQPYIVLERLHGRSLADRLAREGYLPFPEAFPVIDQLLGALAAAHAAGVIHRDLKPANVFLAARPGGAELVKVLDFGISKSSRELAPSGAPPLTRADAVLGTLAYMAPEQIEGAAEVDARADLYAAAAVAFEVLVGRPPFSAKSRRALLALKLDRDAPTLESLTHEHWPAKVERFFRRALARDPTQRFADAKAARRAWRELGQRGRCAPVRHRAPTAGATLPDTLTETRARPRRRG